jgi:cation diffusion facilitator family transporter
MSQSTEYSQEVKKVTVAGMILNLFLSAIKIFAGLYGNSQSVVADGFHSLSDCSTDIALLVGLKYWDHPPDDCHPYGHRRIETLVAFFIGIALALAGFYIGYEAIIKFSSGKYVAPEKIALYAALLSIIIKEGLYRWTLRVAEKLKSSAMMANAWHHRTDALSSVAVSVAIVAALIKPEWAVLDPVAALAVGIFINQAAYQIMKPALMELADTGANDEDVKKIRKIGMNVPGTKSIHAIRTRFHGSGLRVDLHLQVDGDISVTEGHKIAGIAKKALLNDGPDIIDVLVHIEPYEEHENSADSN